MERALSGIRWSAAVGWLISDGNKANNFLILFAQDAFLSSKKKNQQQQ